MTNLHPTSSDGLTFWMYVTAEPVGDFAYELDDYGLVRGYGLWPFWRHVNEPDTCGLRLEPTSARLSPGTAFQAWNQAHVRAAPIATAHYLEAAFQFGILVRPQGLGGQVARVDARLHLDFDVVDRPLELWCPDIVRTAALARLEKIAALIRDLQALPAVTPLVSAHDRETQRRAEAAEGISV